MLLEGDAILAETSLDVKCVPPHAPKFIGGAKHFYVSRRLTSGIWHTQSFVYCLGGSVDDRLL